jgi:beta-mannosidase
VFSDNYFDITSPDGKTVKVLKSDFSGSELSADQLINDIRIKSVADSY